jgi:hypothetical protein
MQYYWLAVGILCCWRITHLLQAEDGPWEIVVRLRRRAGNGFWGKLLDCFYCLSLWVAFPISLALGDSWVHRLFLWPAVSGGAILLERATARPADIAPPPVYYEEPPKGEE